MSQVCLLELDQKKSHLVLELGSGEVALKLRLKHCQKTQALVQMLTLEVRPQIERKTFSVLRSHLLAS